MADSSDSQPTTMVLDRSTIFDLFAIDIDVRKSCGIGFFPPVVARTFEKAALCGLESLKAGEIESAFQEFQRAKEEIVSLSSSTDTT